MKEIGGYFELELQYVGNFPHYDGIFLNSGRNALEYILRSIPNIQRVYIPYYTCEVVLEPINKLQLPYSFYHVDSNLEILENIDLKDNEYLLYTNYFGIKDRYIESIAKLYDRRLIVDNAQALFAPHIDGINTFYSPRKFVGIPDGGVALANVGMSIEAFETDISYDRFSHLIKRIDTNASFAYSDFRVNSHKIVGEPIKQMSKLTRALIDSIDFEGIKNARRENFSVLHSELKVSNKLHIPILDSFECPMVYPYMSDNIQLRSKLIENKIYVATYWPNVIDWCQEGQVENSLCKKILPIPIDQRYTVNQMECIINIIKDNYYEENK